MSALRGLESIFDCMSELITVHDPSCNIVFANKAARKELRLPSLEKRNIKCYEYFHRRNSPPKTCVSKKCIQSRTAVTRKIFEPHLDSYLEVRAIPLFGNDNEVTEVIHIARNITAQKNMENRLVKFISELEDEKTKSEAIISALGDGIIIQDTRYRIMYQNDIQKEIYGDQAGKYCYEVYEGRTSVCEDCPVEKTYIDGKIYRSERKIPTDSGVKYFELTSSPLKNSRGEIIAGIKLVRDITARKLVEQELQKHRNELMAIVEERTGELSASNELLRQEIQDRRQAEHDLKISERKYRHLYDNAPDMYHSLNGDMIVTECNETEARMLGYSKEEIIGRPLLDFLTEESGHLVKSDLPVLKKNKVLKNVERTFIRKDGTTFPAMVNIFAETDRGGNIVKVRAIARDISELKKARAQQQIAEAEALRASHLASLGELAAGVAHEINNPINGIMNYAQMLTNKSTSGSMEQDIAVRIIKESERIANIVRSLLSFAKDSNDEKCSGNLFAIMTEVLALTETQMKKDGIRLSISIPPSLPEIIVIPQQIQQVFLNIISNARYALNQRYPGSHKNKSLEITAERIGGKQPPIIRIVFHDRGTGITPENMKKVMNPFFSTKPAHVGTGLGLSISHGIINNHGGKIMIKSVVDEYTKVIVELPEKTSL